RASWRVRSVERGGGEFLSDAGEPLRVVPTSGYRGLDPGRAPEHDRKLEHGSNRKQSTQVARRVFGWSTEQGRSPDLEEGPNLGRSPQRGQEAQQGETDDPGERIERAGVVGMRGKGFDRVGSPEHGGGGTSPEARVNPDHDLIP